MATTTLTSPARQKLILRTDFSESENVECAIVELTPELVNIVNSRKRTFDMLQEHDEALSSMFFADEQVRFVAMKLHDAELSFKELKDLANGEVLVLPPTFDESVLNEHKVYECEMIVRESGIGWVCSVQGSDEEQLATVEIPYDLILQANVGDPPRRLRLVTSEEMAQSEQESKEAGNGKPESGKKGLLGFLSALKPTPGEC